MADVQSPRSGHGGTVCDKVQATKALKGANVRKLKVQYVRIGLL